MRITRSQLRQIIKEELQREFRSPGYDIPDPDLTGVPDEPQVKMSPASSYVPDIAGEKNAEGNAGLVTMTSWYSPKDKDIAISLIKSPNWPRTLKVLNDLNNDRAVMKMGDRGDAVKIMQLYVKAKLVQQLGNLSSMVATDVELLGGSAGGAAEANSRNVAQRALRGEVISNGDLESATADVLDRLNNGGAPPDGIYGPTTRDAVAIMQEFMQQNYREGFSGAVDGVIGRQTMGYMLGRSVLAAITGA